MALATVCAPGSFQEYVYVPSPPPGVTVALPEPHDVTLLFTTAFAVTGPGAVIVILAVTGHPAASCTFTVYVPALNEVAVSFVCTGAVLHE
jgi:hypothetical protein